MSRKSNYVIGGLTALALGAGAVSYLSNGQNTMVPYQEQTKQQPSQTNIPRLQEPNYQRLKAEQKVDVNQKTDYSSISLEELLKLGSKEVEDRFYEALITDFRDSLDWVGFRGSEKYFKDNFELGYQGVSAESSLARYGEKLATSTDEERLALSTQYGEVINLLNANKGKSIDQIAKENGYKTSGQVADDLWDKVGNEWQNLQVSRTIEDIVGDRVPSQKLDLLLDATKAYCIAKGHPEVAEDLATNIIKYQEVLPERLKLEQESSRRELTEEELETLQSYSSFMTRAKKQLEKVTNFGNSKSEIEKEIVKELNTNGNNLYAFVRMFGFE